MMRLVLLVVVEILLLKLLWIFGISALGNLGLSVFSAVKRDAVGIPAFVIGVLQVLGFALFLWLAVKLPFWVGVLAVSPGHAVGG
ncbi:MAG: hypothetical protein NTV49_05200 [Kiritimatiellaeota bacterium]|nr:hypothetical protein [Kiritimatiellota bacterium]